MISPDGTYSQAVLDLIVRLEGEAFSGNTVLVPETGASAGIGEGAVVGAPLSVTSRPTFGTSVIPETPRDPLSAGTISGN